MRPFTLFAIAAAVIAGLYFGYIYVVQKSMHAVPQETTIEDPLEEVRKQKTRTEETWERQKRMMEEQRQKIKDLQRR